MAVQLGPRAESLPRADRDAEPVLEPIKQPDGTVTDPAADITAYLALVARMEARRTSAASSTKPTAVLDDLARSTLVASFTVEQAEEYSEDRHPADRAGELRATSKCWSRCRDDAAKARAEEAALRRPPHDHALGCTGCHDIPGFEDAKPIGTGLADWGRKETSKLAFEQIVAVSDDAAGRSLARRRRRRDDQSRCDERLGRARGPRLASYPRATIDPNTGFFIERCCTTSAKASSGRSCASRAATTTRRPRTKPTPNGCACRSSASRPRTDESGDHLRAGSGGRAARGEVRVQGHPAPQGDRRRRAAVGEVQLRRLPHGGAWSTGTSTTSRTTTTTRCRSCLRRRSRTIAFLEPHFTPEELAASKKTDRRGLGHAVVTACRTRPCTKTTNGKHALSSSNCGSRRRSTATPGRRRSGRAGRPKLDPGKRPPDRRRLRATAAPGRLWPTSKRTNPNAKASDAWGWVPPPLVGEGARCRPTGCTTSCSIRTRSARRWCCGCRGSTCRGRGGKLVNYFAAVDDVDYPVRVPPSGRGRYLESARGEDKPTGSARR